MKESAATTAMMLGNVPMFAGLTPKQLKVVAESGVERTYKPGETIVKQGDKGIGFYLLLSGAADVRKGTQVVTRLGAGQFFGEMALMDEQPRTADVVASEPTRCLVLSRWEFWGTVGGDPEVIRALFRETVRRLRAAGPGLSE
jgi:monovalent cation:H+ antiporter, CPA1 family